MQWRTNSQTEVAVLRLDRMAAVVYPVLRFQHIRVWVAVVSIGLTTQTSADFTKMADAQQWAEAHLV